MGGRDGEPEAALRSSRWDPIVRPQIHVGEPEWEGSPPTRQGPAVYGSLFILPARLLTALRAQAQGALGLPCVWYLVPRPVL